MCFFGEIFSFCFWPRLLSRIGRFHLLFAIFVVCVPVSLSRSHWTIVSVWRSWGNCFHSFIQFYVIAGRGNFKSSDKDRYVLCFLFKYPWREIPFSLFSKTLFCLTSLSTISLFLIAFQHPRRDIINKMQYYLFYEFVWHLNCEYFKMMKEREVEYQHECSISFDNVRIDQKNIAGGVSCCILCELYCWCVSLSERCSRCIPLERFA